MCEAQRKDYMTVITLPYFWEGEADAIQMKFQSGLRRLHLRKPGSTIDECRRLLCTIPECYHQRIVIHDHHELLEEFHLGGVHLNSRNPSPRFNSKEGVTVSVSCHSIAELAKRKREGFVYPDGTHGDFAYLSLSPIYNSISKEGYNAAFSPDELHDAHRKGIIDSRVYALGGICHDNVDEALGYGFGDVMVLGDAWRHIEPQNLTHSGPKTLPTVLTIAGSDPSAGAGIQQDMKTISNCGCYGTTVITAITSQNTMGVQSVMPVLAEVVESQLRSIFSDIRIDAVKIGMLPDREVAEAVVRVLKEEQRRGILPIVCDPVMISTSGHRLMTEDCVDYVIEHLFPLCTLVTPNLPEAELIDEKCNRSTASFLIKGGHADGDEMTDTLFLYNENKAVAYTSPRIATNNLHGTGCTLSSAIASGLARNKSLKPAVAAAKEYMDCAILGGRDLRIGKGNGPLWFASHPKS